MVLSELFVLYKLAQACTSLYKLKKVLCMFTDASPSQKDAVNQCKLQETEKAASADDEFDENEMGDDDQRKVTRLDGIIQFVTSYIQHHNFGTHDLSNV